MQSLNEELQTVNAELQSKVDEFTRVNNDMKNLLNSTDIATLFLDKELNIRRYTNQATKIFKLIKTDIGRPFTDQVSDLIYPDMTTDALEVLRTLVFIQKQVPTTDGRWFTVRIMPYRTFDDRIDGLVITFIDNTEHKSLEAKLRETEEGYHLLLNSSSDIIVKLSTDLKILGINASAEKYFGKKAHEVVNQSFLNVFVPPKEQKSIEKELNLLLVKLHEGKVSMPLIMAAGNSLQVEWHAIITRDYLDMPSGMILVTK
jgi:two-component system CheB/CheR fusion protein